MKLFPAIDIYRRRAVRLMNGDFDRITVYSDDPVAAALKMKEQGAARLHIVDLAGARGGNAPELETVVEIKRRTGLFCEAGGGVRTLETAGKYLGAGVDRVIFGTAAVEDPGLVAEAVALYGDRIAVGADIKDGFVAVNGWLGVSSVTLGDFCGTVESLGVRTLVCTDVSRDGAMRGANRRLYAELSGKYGMDIIASGGVSGLDDLAALSALGIYGAIVGRAYYEGKIDLKKAAEVCGDN